MYEEEQNIKINVKEVDESNYKKEIIKLLLVMKLIRLSRRNIYKINIYTNLQIDEDFTCDIYFEDIKRKEVRIFNIVSKKIDKKKEDFYNQLKIYGMNETIYNKIYVDSISDDINEMDKQLEEYLW